MDSRPLHPDDIVARKGSEELLGVVERTHGDVDTHEPYPQRDEDEDIVKWPSISPSEFRKFLGDGIPPKDTVLVRWTNDPAASLVPESELTLLDRSLLMGDVVKRNAQDAMSGVVINTETVCTLQPTKLLRYKGRHTLRGLLPLTGEVEDFETDDLDSGKEVRGVPAMELMYDASPSEQELIIYKDWIGRIDVMTCAIVIKLADGCAVEINEDLAEHLDGEEEAFTVGDIVQTKKGHLRNGRWIFGRYSPNTPPVGTVAHSRPIAAEVSWLERRIGSSDDREPPALLERGELESDELHIYDRTRRPKTASASRTISHSEIDIRLGLRVRFKDLSGACVKYDGSYGSGKLSRIDRKETLGYDLNVFDVVGFHTTVTVQWQDLSITTQPSIDLVPDASLDDEHAAWPGEIAHTLSFAPQPGMPGVEAPSEVYVMQRVEAEERMAHVLNCPGASVLYTNGEDVESIVTGKARSLLRGVVGLAAGNVPQRMSLYDIEAPASVNVRRGDIVLVLPEKDEDAKKKDIDWLGEIVDTCLDGTLIVRLGAVEEVRDIKLRREQAIVAIRSDGTGDADAFDEEDILDEMENPEMALDGTPGAWHGDGNLEDLEEDDDEWDGEEEEEPEATYEDENGDPMDEDEVENEEWESDDEDEEMPNLPQQTPPTSHSPTPPDPGKLQEDAVQHRHPAETTLEAPEAYLVLDSAVPPDHHYSDQPSPSNSTRMKRVQKEHKMLRSPGAIPSGVYVRTWETRLDLFRVLFIGPAETPYQDAPFVIDFCLPSDFPTSPPEAYFHSWPSESGLGGVGRINPNLYEDGKICLSLLGTWEGSKGEGWSAARSTLLQVIVSLLGLVLVSEPYFNEAGYEHLIGLEASKRPSALYNERAYLRTRTFIIAALSRLPPPGATSSLPGLAGLESELNWLYFSTQGPGLLAKVLRDARGVLQHSEHGESERSGQLVVSAGACIPLRRAIARLSDIKKQAVHESH